MSVGKASIKRAANAAKTESTEKEEKMAAVKKPTAKRAVGTAKKSAPKAEKPKAKDANQPVRINEELPVYLL